MSTIADLSIGECGTILTVPINLPIHFTEIGFMCGVSVKLIQIAPFKCPLYLIVDDSHFAIRKELAALIEIKI